MRLRPILLAVIGIAVAGCALALIFTRSSPVALFGLVLNSLRSAGNPTGTLTVELRERAAPMAPALESDDGSWPSFNRDLASRRYSPLGQVNTRTVTGLNVICTYDTGLHENFETGPLVVRESLIATSAFDIFSIDGSTCRENWRTHEPYANPSFLTANRGAAYLDGRLFRGTLDGRILAYDFETGRRLWETTIADPRGGEVVDAAPIAWNGLVFIGIAIGDTKGFKGRMYALAAESGNIVWETYLVPKSDSDPTRGPQGTMPVSAATSWGNEPDIPISGGGTWTSYTLDAATGRLYVPVGNPAPDYIKAMRPGTNLFTGSILVLDAKTGNYLDHYEAEPADWHDWDVSNAPAIVTTRGGKQMISFAPKNGHLYGIDTASNQRVYRQPVTRVDNVDTPFSTEKPTHFCPGVVGGGEWNGVAYDSATNLIFTGQSDWCTTITLQTTAKVKATMTGTAWTGNFSINPLDFLGLQDPHSQWAGWLYASDADTGEWKWRAKSNYPIVGGVTATAGGLVIFGDVGGNLYALNVSDGTQLWSQKVDGAIGGGVITYLSGGSQKIAVAAGLTSILWPTEVTTAKIIVLGLDTPATHADSR